MRGGFRARRAGRGLPSRCCRPARVSRRRGAWINRPSPGRTFAAMMSSFMPAGPAGRQVTPDAGAPPALRRGVAAAPEDPGEGPAAGRGTVAGPRPGLRVHRRHAAERVQRHPLVPGDHRAVGAREGLAAQGDEAHVRFGTVRQRRALREHRAACRTRPDHYYGAGSSHEIRPALTQGAEVMDKVFG